MTALGIAIGIPFKKQVVSAVVSAWILATGFWADSGEWIDAETWND